VNLASAGETKLIAGVGDGTFHPDENITFAQAVTILMRVLGYTDADAGYLWPEGYLELAAANGLTAGIPATGGAAISRAWAAKLFCNLLGVKGKGGDLFAASVGKLTPDVMIMDLNAAAPSGASGAIKTSAGTFLPYGDVVPSVFLGLRGTLVTDSSDRVLTFLPSGGESAVVTVSSAGATWIKDASGKRYEIPGKTPMYTQDKTAAFSEIFIDLTPGTAVTIFYSPGGAPDAVYMNLAPASEAVVVLSSGAANDTFRTLTGGGSFTVYKNGAQIAAKDVLKYDVATFDAASRVLSVSDFRMTGYYENAWPNTESPETVTVFGHVFDALPSAAQMLSLFKVGDTFTLLFTSDGRVAGAVKTTEAWSTAIGIVDEGVTGKMASVTLVNGLNVTGNPGLTEYQASQMPGELVSITSDGAGKLLLHKINSNGSADAFNVAERKVGSSELSGGAQIFERVGKGRVAAISADDITREKIPAQKVLYARRDSAGRVDLLVLDDVTGDRYAYGFLTESWEEAADLGGNQFRNRLIAVRNGEGTSPFGYAAGVDFKPGALGGVAFVTDGSKAAGVVSLIEYKNVARADFIVSGEKTTAKLGTAVIPVAADVQCYNIAAKTWFKSLADARAFAETLTVYYDKAPEDGGKIRVVTAG
ncbi:MAG: S-layer homology domain-containing protein, partial [Oscillospiraceae bacterium]|nr:S-layer homology domain-containing protein [Oscillospiraceae bacterium]